MWLSSPSRIASAPNFAARTDPDAAGASASAFFAISAIGSAPGSHARRRGGRTCRDLRHRRDIVDGHRLRSRAAKCYMVRVEIDVRVQVGSGHQPIERLHPVLAITRAEARRGRQIDVFLCRSRPTLRHQRFDQLRERQRGVQRPGTFEAAARSDERKAAREARKTGRRVAARLVANEAIGLFPVSGGARAARRVTDHLGRARHNDVRSLAMSTVHAQRLTGTRLEIGVAAIVEDECRPLKHIARDLIVKVERVGASGRRIERDCGKRESKKRERVLHRPRSI